MNRQFFNNLLYQNLKNGKPRPKPNRGAKYLDGVWQEFENDRNG
jgi:hypothetical protein